MPDPVRYHLDENVDPRIAVALRGKTVEVTTTPEAGLRGSTDDEQFAYAQNAGRVIVTHDEDLLSIASTAATHAGVAYCAQGTRTLGQIIETLLLIHGVLTADDMRDHIEFM